MWTERSSSEDEDRLPYFNYKTGTSFKDPECDWWPLLITNICRKVLAGWTRIIHTIISENQIDLAVFHNKSKIKKNRLEEGKAKMLVV